MCSGLQESSKNTVFSCLSEAGMGSANHGKEIAECQVAAGEKTLFLLCALAVQWLIKRDRCARTGRAGVEHQTRLCGLQQPFYEATRKDGGREEDGPLCLNVHWLHRTVWDQVLLVTLRDGRAGAVGQISGFIAPIVCLCLGQELTFAEGVNNSL